MSNAVMSFQFEGLSIRGRICKVTEALNKIIHQHDYPKNISKFLGEAVILNVLMANSIKLKHKLSLQVHGRGDLKLIATDYLVSSDFKETPKIRGYAKFNLKRTDYTGPINYLMGKGYFSTLLDQGDGSTAYKGLSDLNGSSLSHSAEEFFINSEQLKTRFCTHICDELNKEGKIFFNGIGLMLQYIPDEKRTSKDFLAEKILDKEKWEIISSSFNLKCSEFVRAGKSNFSKLLLNIFENQEIRVFEENKFDFGCSCSPDKVVQTMSIYSKKDIYTMTNSRGKVTADCQFCGANYEFDPSELGQNH